VQLSNTEVMLLGGALTLNRPLADTCRIRIDQSAVGVPSAKMIQGRVSFGACLLDQERVIVCGGAVEQSAITDACEMYCCRRDEWR